METDKFMLGRRIGRTIAGLAVGLMSMQSTMGEEQQRVAITPDAKVQSLIEKVVAPVSAEDIRIFWQDGKKSKEAYFQELRNAAGGRDQNLVLQLMSYHSRATNMQQTAAVGFIIDQMNIPKTTFADVCLPLLDSEDESTRRLGSDWLTRADHNPQGGRDFSRYENILRDRKQNPPQGLIRYMYWRDPQAAVETVARVYGQDVPEAEVAAKAKSGAKKSVDYFVGRPEWWAHLYVAAMMETEPYLRTPELLKKLEQDDNPLVREKVSKLKDQLQTK